ncbi:MAG: hypothetical protein K0S29_211 [Gammaproteobacteria bacterium]|jgi:hypothetical protein|nr:hypothetical protein [Gammaproteobacteria bacterium]
MQGKSGLKKINPQQQKPFIDMAFQDLKKSMNGAYSFSLMNNFFKKHQMLVQTFSPENRAYYKQKLSEFPKQFAAQTSVKRDKVITNMQATVAKAQALNTMAQAVIAKAPQVKSAPVQQSLFSKIASAISEAVKSTFSAISSLFSKAKATENAVSPSSSVLIGTAPNILGPKASEQIVTDGSPASYAKLAMPSEPEFTAFREPAPTMLGEQAAQKIMDELEALAARDSASADLYQAPVMSQVREPEVQLTDLSPDQAKHLAEALNEAEATINREGVAGSLALDIHENLNNMRTDTQQLASALNKGVGIAAGTFAQASKTLQDLSTELDRSGLSKLDKDDFAPR